MSPTPELATIFSTLSRVRRRLFVTRLLERSALGLLAAALLALDLLLARYLRARFPICAWLVAALPLLVPAVLLLRPHKSLLAYLIPASLMTGLLTATYLVLFGSPLFGRVEVWMIPAATATAFLLAATLTTPRISPRAAAIFVDQHAGLKEKVSTALEWADYRPATELEAAFHAPLIHSAVAACATVRSAKVGYGCLDRRVYALTATAVVAAAAVSFLQPLPALAKPHERPNPAVIATASNLADVLKKLEEKKPPKADPVTAKAIDTLRPLVDTLNKNSNMPNLDALGQISKTRQELSEIKDRFDASERAEQALAKSDNETARNLGQALQAMRNAEEKAAQGDPKAGEARDQAAGKLAAAAAEAGEKLASGGMSDKDKKDLKSALEKAGEAAKGDKGLENNLKAAANAAESGDRDKFAKNLSDAANEMGAQMSARAQSGEALRDAMSACDEASRGLGAQENPSANAGNQPKNGDNSGNGEKSAGGQDNAGQQDNAGAQSAMADAGNNGEKGDGQGNKAGSGSDNQGGKGDKGEQGNNASANAGNGDSNSAAHGGSTDWQANSGPGDVNHGRQVGRDRMKVLIYDEHPIANKGPSEKPPEMKLGPGKSAGMVEVKGLVKSDGTTVIDYRSAVQAAERQAQQAIDKQQIPPQYRDLIERYYTDTVKRGPG